MRPEPEPDLDTLTVEELLRHRPEAARIFFRHRMACVGCAMSPFDRLPEAAASYRIPVDEFLEEIRSALGPGGSAAGSSGEERS
ncbi:MAG: DUF1858 domain-containing protein [Thermoanaerobaculia bacterium]